MLLDTLQCIGQSPHNRGLSHPKSQQCKAEKPNTKEQRCETSWYRATLGQFPGLSMPQFLHLKNGDSNSTCFRGWSKRGNGKSVHRRSESVHRRCSINAPSLPTLDALQTLEQTVLKEIASPSCKEDWNTEKDTFYSFPTFLLVKTLSLISQQTRGCSQ